MQPEKAVKTKKMAYFIAGMSLSLRPLSLTMAIRRTRSIAAAHDMIRQPDISSPERGYRSKNRLTAPDTPDNMIQVMMKNIRVLINLYYSRQSRA